MAAGMHGPRERRVLDVRRKENGMFRNAQESWGGSTSRDSDSFEPPESVDEWIGMWEQLVVAFWLAVRIISDCPASDNRSLIARY
jgi:hypothetical protein